MAKLIFVLVFLCFARVVSAQASATAMATATILHSVGAEELLVEGGSNTISFSVRPMQKAHYKNSTTEIKEIDFATFRIVGAAFVYSLWVEPEAANTLQQRQVKKKLTNFTFKPSAVKEEAFVLGSLVDVALACNGAYDEQTKLDVIVHFN